MPVSRRSFLGGGLAASFWLEGQINPDDGSRGPQNFNRRSTVSLSSNTLGELRLGRDYTPSFWNDTVFDPLGGVGTGISLINTIFTNLATVRGAATTANPGTISMGGSDSYVRTSNTIGYFLPPNLGGIYGQVQYALHENTKISNTPDSPSKRGRYAGGRIGWSSGPADVALGYGESTLASTTVQSEKIKSLNLGASYDFGVVKVFGEWSRVRDVRNSAAPFANGSLRLADRYDGLMAGVNVPLGAGMLRASYARVRFVNGLHLPDGNSSVNKLALGYVHNLSKRTALYASVARIHIANGRNNPTVMGVTPLVLSLPAIFPQPGYATTNGMQPHRALGYDVGIRMAF